MADWSDCRISLILFTYGRVKSRMQTYSRQREQTRLKLKHLNRQFEFLLHNYHFFINLIQPVYKQN